ncbi:MAG TPA: hypothetical protein VFP01_09875 [Propionibacteriaceae bacterium]|nr:hypothetical protein [Propionibacteriaceae bacterium]
MPVAFEDPVAHGQEGSVVLLVVLLDNRRAGRGISADAGGLYAVAAAGFYGGSPTIANRENRRR